MMQLSTGYQWERDRTFSSWGKENVVTLRSNLRQPAEYLSGIRLFFRSVIIVKFL